MPKRDSLFSASSLAVLGLCAAAVGRPATASATEGFRPISPDEVKMTSEPHAPGAPAIILFRQVDRNDGSAPHEDNYFRIKILTEEGRKYADVEIPFFRGNENIFGVKARTIRPDSTVVDSEGKLFEKSIFRAKGAKYLAKTFTLPDVQVGSIIEYYYTKELKEHFIFDSHWILSNELFTKSAQFSLKPYHSDYSRINIRWTSRGLPPGTVGPQEGPDHIIRLEAANIPAFQKEELMPPENELKSRVDFIYSDEIPEREPDKFWAKVGKKLNGRLESFVGKHKAMEGAVAEIVAPDDPPEVKLRKIYARVQQMHNTSYEVQRTEQEEKREKEKEAANLETVWESRRGSGVQLTWLFLALVRAAGFEAYGVRASDRRNYFFNPAQMDPNKLDASLVLVKLNGKDLYLDPGAAFTPFGLLPWVETGVQGLRLDKNGGEWVQTTLPESSTSRIERHADLKLSDTGELEGKLTVTFTGLEALSRRVEVRNVDEAERKQFLEHQVKEYIPTSCEPELVNKPEWNSSAPDLVAEFNLKVPGWASGAGRRVLVPVGLFSGTEKHLFDRANRIHPIYVDFPSQKADDVAIDIPPGWQVASLPPGKENEGRVVGYTLKVENDKGRLHFTRRLSVDFLLLETKYYSALREFFHMVKTADEGQVILQPGSTSASN